MSTNKSTCIHSRIIWNCAWTHDSKYFSTSSREGKVVVWGGNTTCDSTLGYWSSASSPLLLKDSVTSLAFAPEQISDGRYVLAAGLESGNIMLHYWKHDSNNPWVPIISLDQKYPLLCFTSLDTSVQSYLLLKCTVMIHPNQISSFK